MITVNDHPDVTPELDGEHIRIRGARVHNLQNLDLDILRDRFVVITGPSGSGKSSLAFDTIFAEGQRQYFESLSVNARQFMDQLERPDVDLIEGLQPTIAIDQRPGNLNPRSTVATVTEIYDYLRLMMARLGQPYCYRCGAAIRQRTPEQIVDDLLTLADGSKVILLAPLVRGRKGQHQETFAAIRKAGFVRARVDGEIYDLEGVPSLPRQKNHTIEAVVDRIVVRPGIRARIAESINLAVKHGDGVVSVMYQPTAAQGQAIWQENLFSTHYACPNCKISYEEIEPRTFSFNSPYGACPACEGLGWLVQFDPELVVQDLSRSLVDVPAKTRQRLLSSDGLDVAGILGLLQEEYENADEATREALDALRGPVPCPECGGARLRPEARHVRVAGKAVQEITALTVSTAREFFAGLSFPEAEAPIAEKIVSQIRPRLEFLQQVGLDYLTLDRAADTLSGGESQRIRLATGIGSGLVGVCYVLDEPSIGLHPRDNDRLIQALRQLQGQGNTVLVVEHDAAIMRQADELIDLGPGAGRHGGQIIAQGPPAAVTCDPRSITGKYLSGKLQIPVPDRRRPVDWKHSLRIEGARAHNLKGIDVRFPLSVLSCITGVSGSGKSSLVNETLAKAVARALGSVGAKPGPYCALDGVEKLDKLVQVDQSPIGRTPRSNPATYTGLFDEIRKVFATTREARLRGYKSGRFSFNAKSGRCEECQGQGQRRIEMNFLPDLYVVCPVCHGQRFNRQTLEIRYRDKSIADVLNLRVDESLEFFQNFPVIHRLLTSLAEVGLGYLALGQSATMLSGGEAQRIKLATELGRVNTGKTLYILDEPTTGLHFDDVRKLLDVLQRLVDLGNTVLVIEHHLDVIKSADWIIDLGPEGGGAGGQVVATGTPEQIAELPKSHTGRWLRQVIGPGT